MKFQKLLLLTLCVLATSVNGVSLKFAMLHKSETQNIAMCVLSQAYANIDIEVEFHAYPTTRSLKLSNSGEYDGETSRVIAAKNKYTNLIPIEVPILMMRGTAFTVNKTDFKPNGFQSLAPFSVIINYAVLFTEKGTENLPDVQKANSYESAFKMLLLNRGEVVVAPYLNGLAILRQLNASTITTLKPAVIEIPLFHFLHKKNKKIAPLITAELKRMEKSGKIKAIYDEYIGKLTDVNVTPEFDNGNPPSVPCS